jgi:hypothetical protein
MEKPGGLLRSQMPDPYLLGKCRPTSELTPFLQKTNKQKTE